MTDTATRTVPGTGRRRAAEPRRPARRPPAGRRPPRGVRDRPATTPTTPGSPRRASRSGCTGPRPRPPIGGWTCPTRPSASPRARASDVPAEFAELVRAAAREAALRPGREHPHGAHGEPTARPRTTGCSPRSSTTTSRVATMGRRADVRAWSEIDLRPGDADDDLLDGVAARVGETGMRPGPPAATTELDRMLRPACRGGARAGRARPGRCSWTTSAARSTGSPPRNCGSAATRPTPSTSCGWRPGVCAAC